VPVADQVYQRVVDLVHSTRPAAAGADKAHEVPDATKWLQWGAGPRAGQMLILGGKARALLHGRFHVTSEDVAALAKPVLRHRLVASFAAQAQGLTTDVIIDRLVAHFKG
jgi:MoxR-like ATPase